MGAEGSGSSSPIQRKELGRCSCRPWQEKGRIERKIYEVVRNQKLVDNAGAADQVLSAPKAISTSVLAYYLCIRAPLGVQVAYCAKSPLGHADRVSVPQGSSQYFAKHNSHSHRLAAREDHNL